MGSQSCEVSASYLSDAFGDLASAVEDCVRGIDESRAVFMEEPGEYRWCLSNVGTHNVRVRILEFSDSFRSMDAGYRDEWVNHDFPIERLRAIERDWCLTGRCA